MNTILTLIVVFCLSGNPTVCENHHERVFQKMTLNQCTMTSQFRAAQLASTLYTPDDGYKFHHAKCIETKPKTTDE